MKNVWFSSFPILSIDSFDQEKNQFVTFFSFRSIERLEGSMRNIKSSTIKGKLLPFIFATHVLLFWKMKTYFARKKNSSDDFFFFEKQCLISIVYPKPFNFNFLINLKQLTSTTRKKKFSSFVYGLDQAIMT